MIYSKSKYNIGDRWEYRENSLVYYIEFNRMHGKMEVWVFGKIYDDGSGSKNDWTTSYQSAKRNHYTNGRFKRVQ